MKLAVVLFFSSFAFAQQSATTSAPCSPIAPENTGTITINCPGMSKGQGQKMIAILNKILADKIDTDKVMAKLDEIQNDIRNLQTSQGWIEPTKDQLAILQGKLTGFPKQKVRIVVTNQDNNKWLIATRLQGVITNASVGWDAETGANSMLAKPIRGIYIGAKSDTLAARALILGIRDLFGQNVVFFTGFSDDKSDANEWIDIYDSPLP
jgi:hypothetical protein